jgi:TrmH family RNA methyltransferase
MKLERLPRHQRLRKLWKIFSEAEKRFIRGGQGESGERKHDNAPAAGELSCLSGYAAILLLDTDFSPPAAAALREASEILSDLKSPALPVPDVRRAINVIRHILLAETGRSPADWDLLDGEGVLDVTKRRIFGGVQVYFQDIRSPFNVGAMFRTAESFGVEKVFLSPLCADPRHPRAERTAMGCVDVLPWERLREDPFVSVTSGEAPLGGVIFDAPVFALETGGTPLKEFRFPEKGLFIVGSEELGVSPKALAASDASLGRVSIQTYGAKGSLNVSSAFSIAMQRWAEALTIN